MSPSRSSIKIHTLPSVGAGPKATPSLKEEIELGLLGTAEPHVPGNRAEDREWSFKRRLPTVLLYDEKGLRLYDDITSKAPEYYLFNDELELLKNHGEEIARSMGFPSSKKNDEEQKRRHGKRAPLTRWKPARWGDSEVGKWNNGVNGEEGLGGGIERGWDVVELGAGALRKTAHLLTALSSTLPEDQDRSPITYHALDLSYPELERVLGEMEETFGPQLKDKVECLGLHGDYEAGLQFIRDGKLSTLSPAPSPVTAPKAGQLKEGSPERAESDSPPLSPFSDALVTPGPETISLLSGITDPSEVSKEDARSASGTWSPVDSEMAQLDLESSEHVETLASPPAKHTTSPKEELPARPLHIMFLGSSLGNFERDQAAPFLKALPLRQGDTLLLGLDGRPSPGPEGRRKVETAYNDPAGYTRAFEEHAWDIVRKELDLKDDAGMTFFGRYNETLGRHEAYLRSNADQTVHLPLHDKDVHLEENEVVNLEWSYKYSYKEALELFEEANLRVVDCWKAPESEYRLWLLERPEIRFHQPAVAKMTHADKAVLKDKKTNVPKWDDWNVLWKLWDHITLAMISEDMLHQKPIDLRHICLFYLGHIPTFLDIHLTIMLKGKHTEPERFKDIFERGIDPDVDDPTKIHSHSEVPTQEADWPTLQEILGFRDRVRQRLGGIYDDLSSDKLKLSRHIARVLHMTFEHEAQHAETLLYMLLQSPLTRPPAAVAYPQWDSLATRWRAEAVSNQVLSIPGGPVELGHHDIESEDKMYPTAADWGDHEFGWDIENPKVVEMVKAFKVDALPISNSDYMRFLKSSNTDFDTPDAVPASWVKEGEVWKVKTLYGPVGFEIAGLWPLTASKDEIDAYAKSKGGRVPTEAELQLLWQSDEGPRPAGKLANVGFRNWHPIPPTITQTDNAGRVLHGHNGGVWEWTSTPLTGHKEFIASELYPGYSADFFDGKHYVVLGGSFATVTTIAGRRSFTNWYQANYRYTFAGGRVVYDH